MTPAERKAERHAYYLKNKARFAEASARWSRAHPERNRAKALRYLRKKKAASV